MWKLIFSIFDFNLAPLYFSIRKDVIITEIFINCCNLIINKGSDIILKI
jgi:hypothetical protein